jgi:hypothetical protein
VATQIENTRASVRKSLKKSTGALKVLAPYLNKKLQTKLVCLLSYPYSKIKILDKTYVYQLQTGFSIEK